MHPIRTFVYTASFVGGVGLYLVAPVSIRAEFFGLGACFLLFLSLIPGGVYALLPNGWGRVPFQKAKKALGISAFFFAAMYALLGWRSGLFTSGVFSPWTLGAGIVAGVLLAVLAITSLHAIKQRMRPWWKPLHRSVYAVGLLAAIHGYALMAHMGTSPTLLNMFLLLIGALTLVQLVRFSRFVLQRT